MRTVVSNDRNNATLARGHQHGYPLLSGSDTSRETTEIMEQRGHSTMTQLARAVSIRDRWDREVDELVVQAMDEGESRELIATTIGKSREHLRTIRRRVETRRR